MSGLIIASTEQNLSPRGSPSAAARFLRGKHGFKDEDHPKPEPSTGCTNVTPGCLDERLFGKLLVQAGTPIGMRDCTAFVLQAVDEDPGLVNRASCPCDWRLLYWSAVAGNASLTRGLIDRGAKIGARTATGWDALMAASHAGRAEVVDILLKRGADPNSVSADNWTPLAAASRGGHLSVCLLLIFHGANLFARVRDCFSAFDLFASGLGANKRTAEEVKEQHRAILRQMFANQQRWARRWPFMNILVGSSFRPLAGKPSTENRPLPLITLDTSEGRRAYYMRLVFSCDGLVRQIVCFL